MSKRKKTARPEKAAPVAQIETDPAETPEELGRTTESAHSQAAAPPEEDDAPASVTSQHALPDGLIEQARGTAKASERALLAALRVEAETADVEDAGAESAAAASLDDVETTVNVAGDMLPFPGRDDLDAPTVAVAGGELEEVDGQADGQVGQRKHLRGLLEALIFASDLPIKAKDLAKLADAPLKTVLDVLADLRQEYSARGIHLEELATGWVFRTSARYAPFIRDLTKERPVRLTRAQVETLAIIAYRQPITRPEIDDVRGVDSGPVLKLLLERDLVRILGKRDEVGRPIIYGTTLHFLEFFGLKSLKDLPTLREFTELTDESRDAYEAEMGEPPNDGSTVQGEDEDGMRAPYPTAPDIETDDDAHGRAEEEAIADDTALLDHGVDDGPTMITKMPKGARDGDGELDLDLDDDSEL